MRTRVLIKRHKNGSTITVKLKRKTVVVEGTRNGRDIAIIKLERTPGWRDRFQVVVDDLTKERKKDESTVQAQLPSAASC
jgi:hypothetical protein